MRLKRLSLLVALIFFGGATSAQAQELPGGLAGALPGGLAGALPGGSSDGSPMTITEDQIALLPADQQQAVREALEKAKAEAGAAPSVGSTAPMPSGGSMADMFKNITSVLEKLTPEQKKMVEEAQKSGKLPEGFSDMLLAGTLNASVLAQLSPEQISALEAVRDSGELTAENLNAILGQVDASTVKEIATAIKDKKPVDVEKIKEVAKKVATIVCTKGKKTIKVAAKKCPAGFKKKS
jgi:hypothetical protein